MLTLHLRVRPGTISAPWKQEDLQFDTSVDYIARTPLPCPERKTNEDQEQGTVEKKGHQGRCRGHPGKPGRAQTRKTGMGRMNWGKKKRKRFGSEEKDPSLNVSSSGWR